MSKRIQNRLPKNCTQGRDSALIFASKISFAPISLGFLILLAFGFPSFESSAQYVSFFDLDPDTNGEEIIIQNDQSPSAFWSSALSRFDSLEKTNYSEAILKQEGDENPPTETISLGISSEPQTSAHSLTIRNYRRLLHSRIRLEPDSCNAKNRIANDLRAGMQSLPFYSFDHTQTQDRLPQTTPNRIEPPLHDSAANPELDFYEKIDCLAESTYELDLRGNPLDASLLQPKETLRNKLSMGRIPAKVMRSSPGQGILPDHQQKSKSRQNVFAWTHDEFESYRQNGNLNEFNLAQINFNLNADTISLLELNYSSQQGIQEVERNFSTPHTIWFSSYNSTTKFEFSTVNFARTLSYKNKSKDTRDLAN